MVCILALNFLLAFAVLYIGLPMGEMYLSFRELIALILFQL
jgi:hypothetical protein